MTEMGEILDDLVKKGEKLFEEDLKFLREEDSPQKELTQTIKEDYILDRLNLGEVNKIIDRIEKKQQQIETLAEMLEEDKVIKKVNKVFVKPDFKKIESGRGKNKERKEIKYFPRLLTLVYILNNDFKLKIDDGEAVEIEKGKVTEKMARKTPYYRLIIPELDRVIYVCNEENNITFIFSLEKVENELEKLDGMSKSERREMIKDKPGVGITMAQSATWRERMKKYLTEEIPIKEISDEELVMEGELKKSREFTLSPDDLIREIRQYYYHEIEQGVKIKNFSEWYANTIKKYNLKTRWPIGLDLFLRRRGHWPKKGKNIWRKIITGREKITFEGLTEKVREGYKKMKEEGGEMPKSFKAIYSILKKRYDINNEWPKRPNISGKYSDFREFITGKKNMGKEEFLKVLIKEYAKKDKKLSIMKWYEELKKENDDLPNNPGRYLFDGWKKIKKIIEERIKKEK